MLITGGSSYGERFKRDGTPDPLAAFFPWERGNLENLKHAVDAANGRLRWETLNAREFARLEFVKWCIANGRHYSHLTIAPEGES